MLQYKIPQNVQIEDKILGPLTLKQLGIVAAGGGISYSIFLILSKTYFLSLFDYFFIAIPLFISLAFAFLRVHDVSFLKWLLLLFEFGHNSRRRRWDKAETAKLHFTFVTAKTGEVSTKKKTTKKKPGNGDALEKKFSSLEELTHILDHSSQFAADMKTVPNDHDDENALHLSASEKARHEERISRIGIETKKL